MAYLTDGIVGAQLTTTTAGTTTDGANALYKLGTRAKATDGQEYQYVQAGAAIAQYDCVAIDENFQAVKATRALAANRYTVGWAQVAFSDNDLGWVCRTGSNFSGNVLKFCAADAELFVSATAGALDDAAASATASQMVVQGVTVAVAAASASATQSVELRADWPQFVARTFAAP